MHDFPAISSKLKPSLYPTPPVFRRKVKEKVLKNDIVKAKKDTHKKKKEKEEKPLKSSFCVQVLQELSGTCIQYSWVLK